jgi:hypothetical protein
MSLESTLLEIIRDNRKEINNLFKIPEYLKEIAEHLDTIDSRLMALEKYAENIEGSIDNVADRI